MVNGGSLSMPRVVIAAPGSGHGKTSVATGLLAALAARGLTVSPHKVGPDYIDPGYHALAAGRPGRNLDPWLVGADRIAGLFGHGATTPTTADVAVIEGVMGLLDGSAEDPGFASTAHVARLLSAPVVLVIDASATGRSVLAPVLGFLQFDPSVRIGGVILNRVGSPRHRQILTDALAEVGVGVLGTIARDDRLETPSRHLGLIPAAERAPQATATVTGLGRAIAASVDVDAVLALARTAPPLPDAEWDHGITPVAGTVGAAPGAAPRIAVAGGAAFTFSYAETVELLTAAGAQVEIVDPLQAERLPTGTAGLVIGGGFPEAHLHALADNAALRSEVAALAASGAPVAAECAGLLYLSSALDGSPMTGALECRTSMSPRLSIGYRQAVAASDSVLFAEGTRVNGHEFHRTAADPGHGHTPAWHWRDGGEVVTEGFVAGNLHASYLHLNWAGYPLAAARFVTAAARHDAGVAAR